MSYHKKVRGFSVRLLPGIETIYYLLNLLPLLSQKLRIGGFYDVLAGVTSEFLLPVDGLVMFSNKLSYADFLSSWQFGGTAGGCFWINSADQFRTRNMERYVVKIEGIW
jgi:hypothetical protein